MSQAESLLNSLSETANTVSDSPINDLLIIDADNRIVNVPSTEILFGVETDLNVERKHFLCPRFVGDNIDLSELDLEIHYKNALGKTSVYPITDAVIGDEHITFSWLLGGSLFAEKGTVYFSIRGVTTEKGIDICRWNTAIASGKVIEGLIGSGVESDDNPYGLPRVTEADNDKMLLVVDGKWQLIPNEIPEEVINSWFEEELT